MPLKLKTRQKSKVPKGIATDEDFKLVDKARGIFIVADGMGGHPAGDEASRIAVIDAYQTFLKYIPHIRRGRIKEEEIPDYVSEAMKMANEAVYGLSSSVKRFRSYERRAGTTILFGYFFNNQFYLGNVGDSRAYLLRGDNLERLTKDHSSIDDSADEAARKIRELSGGSGLQRYIGQARKLEPDLISRPIECGDIILMATDGLTKLLYDLEIKNILSTVPFEKSAVELARATDYPKMLIERYAGLKNIGIEDAKKHLKNQDSVTIITLKAFEGGGARWQE